MTVRSMFVEELTVLDARFSDTSPCNLVFSYNLYFVLHLSGLSSKMSPTVFIMFHWDPAGVKQKHKRGSAYIYCPLSSTTPEIQV